MKVFIVTFLLFVGGVLQSCTTQEVDTDEHGDVHLSIGSDLIQLTHKIFQSCITLRNAHHGSFIYSAQKHNQDTVRDNPIWVLAAENTHAIDDTGYIAAEVEGFAEDLRTFNVTLKGTKYNMFYVMADTPNHQVLGWDSEDTPNGHIWTVQLLNDNKVKIYQNDYVMCAADIYNSQRINVAGRRGLNDSECIWIVDSCDANEKDGSALYQSALNDWKITAELMKLSIIKYGYSDFNKIFDHAMQKLEQIKDRRVFEVMLQAYLTTFDKNNEENRKSFARNLKHFRKHSSYDTVNDTLKSLADKNMRTVFQLTHKIFQPCVTLRNAHHGFFVYTAVKHNKDEVKNNPIWMWTAQKVIDNTGYIASEVEGFDDGLRIFNVTLKGTKYNMFYIMADSPSHQVLGWDSKETPSGHFWTVELLKDDKVKIYQNDYVMCAADIYNSKRVNVAGRRDLIDSECVWIVDSCGVKYNKNSGIDKDARPGVGSDVIIEERGNALYQSALNDSSNTTERMKSYIIIYGYNEFNKIVDYSMQKLEQSKNRTVFEVILRAHLATFDKNSEENRRSFARNLKHFQKNSLYDTVNDNLISLADKNMRTVFQLTHKIFQPCVTLRNAHHGFFIYTAVKHNKDEVKNNPIWIWTAQKSIDNTGYIAAEVEGFDDDLRIFNVTLKGTKYNMLYIMADSASHQVLGWDSKETPSGHFWMVELLKDDKVKIYQNDYVMCAADVFNNKRVNVAGRRDLTDSQCIWIVESCGV